MFRCVSESRRPKVSGFFASFENLDPKSTPVFSLPVKIVPGVDFGEGARKRWIAESRGNSTALVFDQRKAQITG